MRIVADIAAGSRLAYRSCAARRFGRKDGGRCEAYAPVMAAAASRFGRVRQGRPSGACICHGGNPAVAFGVGRQRRKRRWFLASRQRLILVVR